MVTIHTSDQLLPELMDIARLFPEAGDMEIAHEVYPAAGDSGMNVENRFCCEKAEKVYIDSVEGEEVRALRDRFAVVKRYAKLAFYKFLSEICGRELPWGSITGIRPTRLAYRQLAAGGDFRTLLRKLGVSEANTELVGRVIEGQKGIRERKEGNADLYVSLPFCPTKCDYCSFITAPIDKTKKFIPAYLDALQKELDGIDRYWKNLRAVYVGGGTPSALDAEDLKRVFEMIEPLRANGCEYTVEAGRPDVFSEEKLDLCKEYGVTRICINAQSFSDATLQAIGRKHTRKQLYEAFEMAKPYGFLVNCDLIAGLADERAEDFEKSLTEAIGLAPQNITVHTLCLKKGAKLKEETERLQDGCLAEMIALSREMLTQAGYEPYYLYRQKYMAGAHENVGWTKKGCASVYNIDVMEETTDNVAVGANAISKKVFLEEDRIERLGAPKDLTTYLAGVDKLVKERETLFLDQPKQEETV